MSCLLSKSVKFWYYDPPCLPERFLSSFSLRRTRTVTTAVSVWFVCQTCAIHSYCPAGTCVSAMRVQTHCDTRPTTAPSADCVSVSLISALIVPVFGHYHGNWICNICKSKHTADGGFGGCWKDEFSFTLPALAMSFF